MNRPLNRSLGLVTLLLLCMSIALLETNALLGAEIAFFSAPQAEKGMTLKAGKDNIFFCLGSGTFQLMEPSLQNDSSIHLIISEFKSQDVKQVVKTYRSSASQAQPGQVPALTVFEKGKLYDVLSDRDLAFQCNTGLTLLTKGVSLATPSTNMPSPTPPVITDRSFASPSNNMPASQGIVLQQSTASASPNMPVLQQDTKAGAAARSPLFLTLNDPSPFVKPGDLVMMVLEMKNIGQTELDSVSFSITLPDGYRIPTGAATGNCTGADKNVTCTNFALGENQSMSFSFPFVVLENAACGKQEVTARGNALPKGQGSLSASQSNIARWSVVCPGSSAAAESSATNSINDVSSAAQSSASSSPTVTTVSPPNDKISVELTGYASVKAPGNVDVRMVIRNKTSSTLTNILYAMPARMGTDTNATPTQGCAIVGGNIICSNISIPAGSAYSATLRYPVTFSACGNQPMLQNTVQKLNASGSPDVSLTTVMHWQWDCSGTTQTNNWAEISGSFPAHVLADTPVSWTMAVRNKMNATILTLLTMTIPEGTTYAPMPGCGQSGPMLSCGGDPLPANQSQIVHLGNLTFPKSMCGKDIPLGTMRDVNPLGGGVIIVMAETKPLTVHVDCESTQSSSSGNTNASSSIIIDTFPSSSSKSSVSNQPLSITLSGPAALQKNTSASYALAIKNTSSLNLPSVSFTFTFPTGVSTDAVSNSPNCTITSTSMSCRNFSIQPGLGLNLTLPIKTLSTLPCTDFPVKVTVNAIGMIMESNTIMVKGCTGESNGLPTTLLTMIKPVLCDESSSSQETQGTNDPYILKSIILSNDKTKVTVDYHINGQSCGRLLTTDHQPLHSQNIFCQVNGPATVQLSQLNSLFGTGSAFMLCDGNNNNLCSPPVIALDGDEQASSSSAPACQSSTTLGYLPKNSSQTLQTTIVTSKNGFTDGTLHLELPAGLTLSEPVNDFQAGTCTVQNNTMDCTGINRDPSKSVIYTLPFTVSDAANCGAAQYTATFSYTEQGERKQLVKSQGMQLCSAAASSSSGPINQFAITTGDGVCASADCRTVTIPVTLKNMSPNVATNVLVTAKLDASWSGGSMNNAACQIVDAPGQRMLDCPGGPYLTVPAQSTVTYPLTLTTNAPCPINPARTAVLLQSAPASVYEKDYSDNSVYASIPAPCQSTGGTTGGTTAGTDGPASSSSAATTGGGIGGTNPPLTPVLSSIVVKGDTVTVEYQNPGASCAHLLNGDLQIVHSQNSFCDPHGPANVSLATMNTLFGVGKTFMLCNGNDQNLCSSPVTVTEEAASVDWRNMLSFSQNVMGVNGNTCLDVACGRLLVPLLIRNKATGEAKDVKVTVAIDPSWANATIMGLPCTYNFLATKNANNGLNIYDCKGLTIRGNTDTGMGIVLTRTSACPVANFKQNAAIQLTPDTSYANDNPNNTLTTSLPLPCQK